MVGELQAGDPQSVGPYRVLGRLGAGGMGRVYLGRSAGGRLVAVKIIRPELAGEPGFRARFAREVAAARNVSGLFTALVVDADVDGPMPWLATAYVAGPSLAEAVEAGGPLPVDSLLTLAAGLAEGLQAIHAAGVVHRDLKPSNVLLAHDGPRVIDFGISRAAEATMLTQSGMVVGSPGFMSPEQARGEVVGPPSDVFSLGAVLAFAATGEGPFGQGPTPALVYRVVHQEPDTVRLPEPIRPLVERCLAKDPGQRPAAADLLAELGSAELAADWLPESLTGVLGRYTPPPADTPALESTVTSGGARQTIAAAARPPADQPRRRRPRHTRRRLAWLVAGVALIAAAATAVTVVPRADGTTPGARHQPAVRAGTTREHLSAVGGRSDPQSTTVKKVSRVKKKSRVPGTSSSPAAPAGPTAPPTGTAVPGPPPSSPSPAPVPSTGSVPNVLDTTLSAATSALEASGFHNIPYLYGCYSSRDIDDVVRQDPGGGARIALTAPVQLYLQADNCYTVPDVIGMSLSDAAFTLKEAGFDNIPYLYGCYGSANIGAVVSQSPAAGTSYGSNQPVSLKLQANNC